MGGDDITMQLREAASKPDFLDRASELTERWSEAKDPLRVVELILRFMEEHPGLDFGTPGPLVHFVERFYGSGYESRLVESVRRRPTSYTISMLNAIINGTKSAEARSQLIAVMAAAAEHPLADDETSQSAQRFIARFQREELGEGYP